MRMQPIISVIVPVYQVEKFLNQCIESIVQQTFTDFELILVDDGSEDNCAYICDIWDKQDPRIKVIHKENGGLSSARNTGLEVAQGEYITFIDSDDIVGKNFLEQLYQNIEETKSDIVICRFEKITEKGKPLEGQSLTIPPTIMNQQEAMHFLVYEDSVCMVVAWNKLYKKTLWKTLRYPLGKINEDEFVIHHLIQASTQISYVNSCLYYYRERQKSIMNRITKNINFDATQALLERYYFLKEKDADKKYLEKSLRNYWAKVCQLSYEALTQNSRIYNCNLLQMKKQVKKHAIKIIKAEQKNIKKWQVISFCFSPKLSYFIFRILKKKEKKKK